MLGECFKAWANGDNNTDADAGAFMAAKFVNAVLDALGVKR